MKKPNRFREDYYRIDRPGTPDHPFVPDGLTELRTHGVSGAPPEDLLNDPHPLFVSGDEAAGFYRRLEPPEVGPDRNVEAYSWSAISSRSRSRAFWLLLFPFAMVNHAGWMVGPKRNGGMERAVIRLVGLALTVHYALWAMVVFVDLLAYQCGRLEGCRNHYLLGWFNSIRTFVGDSVIRQIVVFSAFPLATILVLLWTGRGDPRNVQRWVGQPDGTTGTRQSPLVDHMLLRDPRFWQATEVTRLLGLSHGVGALAAVAATLAGSVAAMTEGPAGTFRSIRVVLWSLAGISALLVVVAAGRVRLKSNGTRTWRRAIRLTGVATWLAIALLIWNAWNAPVTRSLPVTLPSLRNAFDFVLVTEFALLMLYFLKDQIRMFAAIPLIGSALFWALSRPAGSPIGALGSLPGPPWAQWLGAGLLFAVAGVGIYSLRNRLTGSQEKVDGVQPPDSPEEHLNNQFWVFFGLAPVFLAALLSVRAAPSAGVRWGAGLAGSTICISYLMASGRLQIRRAHDYAPRWKLRVGGPGTLAAVGATALTLVSAAVIVFAAQRLGSATPVGRSGAPLESSSLTRSIGYYDELGWIAAAGLGALLVFALAFQTRISGLWRFRFRHQIPNIDRRLEDSGHSPELPHRVARAQLYAGLLDDLDWLVTVGITAFMACSFSVITGQLLRRSAADLDRFVGFASWLLVSLAFVVIWVVRGAQKDTGLRRAIGTLWEVTGFFPRRFHPLAPPSYGERSVPELRGRLLDLTEGSRSVLLLAHSQGTLLSTAVLESLLGEQTRERLRRLQYVTYGSMLQRSYGRSFPHLVRPKDLIELKAVLEGAENHERDFPPPPGGAPPRWINFGRTTDFLGGRLFVEPHRPPGCLPEEDRPDDVYFEDPPVPSNLVGGDTRLWGHSFNYLDQQEDPRFRSFVEQSLGSAAPAPVEGE